MILMQMKKFSNTESLGAWAKNEQGYNFLDNHILILPQTCLRNMQNLLWKSKYILYALCPIFLQ